MAYLPNTKQTDGATDVTNISTSYRGVVKYAGNIDTDDPVVAKSNLGLTRQDHRSIDLVQITDYVEKALSAGIFDNFPSNKFVIKKVSYELAGVANSALTTGGADYERGNRGIHKVGAARIRHDTLAMRENQFNETTGDFESGFPVVAVSGMWDITNGAVATEIDDVEANASRSLPGQFSYQNGSVNPVRADYESRGGSEI